MRIYPDPCEIEESYQKEIFVKDSKECTFMAASSVTPLLFIQLLSNPGDHSFPLCSLSLSL